MGDLYTPLGLTVTSLSAYFLIYIPSGPLFLFAWGAFLVTGFLMIRYLTTRSEWWTILFTIAIVGFQLFIYLFTALKNPGIVSNPNPSPEFEIENGHLPK